MATKPESKLSQIIKKRFKTMRDDNDEVFEEAEQNMQLYRGVMTESADYPWDTQYVDNQVFPIMRNHLSRLNPAEARIKLTGHDEDRRIINQKVVNWELNENLLTQIMYKIMFSGFMRGRGYGKTGWRYKPSVVIQADGGRKVIMRDMENRADISFVRFNDLMIPNRNIPELSLQPYMIERLSMRWGDLMDDQEKTGRWKQDLLEKIMKGKHFLSEVDLGVDLPKDDALNEKEIVRSQYVSMLVMYTVDGGEIWTMEDGIDGVLNKDEENRYWHGHAPYIDFCPFPEDDEFYSLGVVRPIADLQMAMSSSLNQLLTNSRKAGNPMWIVAGEANQKIPDWNFVNRPDGVIKVPGEAKDIQPAPFYDTTNINKAVRGELQVSLERTSGVSSLYTSGAASTPTINGTATGAKIIDQNIDTNMQLLISLFGAQILKTAGEHFLELNAQYITEAQVFEITNREGKSEELQVSPDQISANFKVQASPERMLKVSQTVKLASLQNTITTMEASKSIQKNMKPLYEALINESPGLEDIDGVVIDPEQKANEVIEAIMKGVEPPEAKWDDDHKAMMAVIQKHLLDMNHDDLMLTKFAEYLGELKRWIEAKNPNMAIAPPPEPAIVPTDPQALAQSMSQSVAPNMNPAADMPVPMTQDQLGIA